jgi:hypothetical protein
MLAPGVEEGLESVMERDHGDRGATRKAAFGDAAVVIRDGCACGVRRAVCNGPP